VIRYIKHNEIDKKKWDECIAHSFNGIIYGYSWYLDIVCPGWEALVEEDYRKVMPLTGRSKLGIRYLYQPFFTQQLGVFSVDKLTGNDVARFLDAIPAHFKLVEISLNTFNKLDDPAGYEMKRSLTHELDLIPSYETLHAQYSNNAKRNLKKGIKNGLTLAGFVSPGEVIALFKSGKGKEVSSFTGNHYAILALLINECMSRGVGQVWGANDKEGKLCAGCFFVESNGKSIFLFSGRSAEAKANGAMFFLIDRFIAQNAQRNLVLDFEGSNDPNLARFYKSFGSKECVYLQVRKNNLPALIRWLKKAK
jgi:hypothetical protein